MLGNSSPALLNPQGMRISFSLFSQVISGVGSFLPAAKPSGPRTVGVVVLVGGD